LGGWGLAAPQPAGPRMKVRLILEPRFGNSWVHYDHYLEDCETGQSCGYLISTTQHNNPPPYPSFKSDIAIGYISSPDKKKWRQERQFEGYKQWDRELKVEDFGKKLDIINMSLCSEDFIQSAEITEVIVKKQVYIDPRNGTVWMSREISEHVYSKRAWVFKQVPKKGKFICINPYFYCKIPLHTAFLSGPRLEHINPDAEDFRKFLYEKVNKSKKLIIKSAARHFKKISKRVLPIAESTKLFFKSLGVFKHLQQTYSYAK
jgi:hypothetical protein